MRYRCGPATVSEDETRQQIVPEREAKASALYAAGAEALTAVGAPVAYDLQNVGGKNFIHGHTASFALFRPM